MGRANVLVLARQSTTFGFDVDFYLFVHYGHLQKRNLIALIGWLMKYNQLPYLIPTQVPLNRCFGLIPSFTNRGSPAHQLHVAIELFLLIRYDA